MGPAPYRGGPAVIDMVKDLKGRPQELLTNLIAAIIARERSQRSLEVAEDEPAQRGEDVPRPAANEAE